MRRRAPIIAAVAVIASTVAFAVLAQEGRWREPIPSGLYAIQPVHSDLCLAQAPDAWPRVAHLEQRPCVEGDPAQIFTVVEQGWPPDYMATIRVAATGVAAADACATVARGVIFGAPAIDTILCNGRGETACPFNADDQAFHFRRVGPVTGDDVVGVFEVRAPDEQCWDVRDASTAPGGDLIRWQCHGGSNQHFRFRSVGEVSPDYFMCEAGHLELAPPPCPMPPCT